MIRIGILMDSFDLPAWAYRMLEQIKKSNYAEIVLVILKDVKEQKKPLFLRIVENHNKLFYLIYSKLDKKLFSI
ncbi:MAG: hypothetical protein HYS56_05190, partial [Candidatus Omnitrophica bacterium]|nr:hypothetical protein [Candidatus Omnitrophota bacterium]